MNGKLINTQYHHLVNYILHQDDGIGKCNNTILLSFLIIGIWSQWGFQIFYQYIKRSGIHWIRCSNHQGTKYLWSYHLICMRKYIYKVYLKKILKLFKCPASSSIHTISRWLNLPVKALHQERKKRKNRILTKLVYAYWVMVVLPLFIDIWFINFLQNLHNYVYIYQHL